MAITLSADSQIAIGGSFLGRLVAWDYAETDTQVDITSFDSTAEREYMDLGLIDVDFNITAQFDLASVGQDNVRAGLSGGSAVGYQIFPAGFVTGRPRLYGNMLVGSVSVSADSVDGVVSTTFTAKILTMIETVA